MMEEERNYSLPEFCTLTNYDYEEKPLYSRFVFIHIPTGTIVEAIHLDEFPAPESLQPQYNFVFKNWEDKDEEIVLALHETLIEEEEELNEIFLKCANWYCKYLEWEDEGCYDIKKSLEKNEDSLFSKIQRLLGWD